MFVNVITGINEINKHKNIKNSMSTISKLTQTPAINTFTNLNNLTYCSLQIWLVVVSLFESYSR